MDEWLPHRLVLKNASGGRFTPPEHFALYHTLLVSWGCWNKLLQSVWLRTNEMYSLTARVQKSKAKVGVEPRSLPRLQGKVLPASSASGIGGSPWHSMAVAASPSLCPHLHVAFFSSFLSLCLNLSLTRTLSLGIDPP